jgi:hypothetical protein
MLLAAQQASPAAPAAPTAKKQKPAQICEYIEITGSRAKQRVCRDATGHLDLGPGVSDSAFGKGTFKNEDPKVPSMSGSGG